MLGNKNKNLFSGMSGKWLTALIAAIIFVVFVIIALCAGGSDIKNFAVILICECLIGICAYFIFCLSKLNKTQNGDGAAQSNADFEKNTDDTYDNSEYDNFEDASEDSEKLFEMPRRDSSIKIGGKSPERGSDRSAERAVEDRDGRVSEARVFEKVDTPKYIQTEKREAETEDKGFFRRNTGELTKDNMDEILNRIETMRSEKTAKAASDGTEGLKYAKVRKFDINSLGIEHFDDASENASGSMSGAGRTTSRQPIVTNDGGEKSASQVIETKTPQIQKDKPVKKEISKDELFTGSLSKQPANEKKIGGDFFKGTGYRSPFEKNEENK